MGPMATRIQAQLTETLQPIHLELSDESRMHSGPATETHFNLVVVSEAFAGLRLVRRHQLVYDSLAAELRDGVHALTMRTLTPAEWSEAGGLVANLSPPCAGGSKADG